MILELIRELADSLDENVTEKELILWAQLIEAEAEGEPLKGKIAVGAVLLNRLRSPLFPKTISDIIMQPDQFESVGNGRLSSIKEPQAESWKALQLVLSGNDPADGALYFFNPNKTTNQWLRKKKVKLAVGDHLFVV